MLSIFFGGLIELSIDDSGPRLAQLLIGVNTDEQKNADGHNLVLGVELLHFRRFFTELCCQVLNLVGVVESFCITEFRRR